MAAGRPHTRALHQEESGGARRAHSLKIPDPASVCVCVQTGVFLRYHLEKSSERSPLSDQQSPARTLLYTSVARQKQAGAKNQGRTGGG